MTWIHADIQGETLNDELKQAIQDIPQHVRSTLETLQLEGHGAWLVGGCVRDLFLKNKTTDYDIATTSTPEQTIELFGERAVPTGIDFGTVTLKGEIVIEITTLRTDGIYEDQRHPVDVTWGKSLLTDLERRDFTINAMAIDIGLGMLYDPFHGKYDAQRGLLKGVGDPFQRCNEDVLRVLRAFRFLSPSPGVMFQMDLDLLTAVKSTAPQVHNLSVERIWSEIKRILDKDMCHTILHLMIDSGVFTQIFPSSSTPTQKIIDCISTVSTTLNVHQKFGLLWAEAEPNILNQHLTWLKASNKEKKEILQFHSILAKLPMPSKSSIRIFHYFTQNTMEDFIQLHGYLARNKIHVHKTRYISIKDAEEVQKLSNDLSLIDSTTSILNGQDIMQSTGISEGIKLGRIKEWMHRIQIEKAILTKEDMMIELAQIDWAYIEVDEIPRLEIQISE